MGEAARPGDAADNATDDDQTVLVRDYYNEAARSYDSWMVGFDRVMLGRGRSRMCSRARGPTLEVAVGTGANLPFYPPDVKLTGVDLSPAMLAFAERRAQKLDLDIDLGVGDAEGLDFPDDALRDGHCDAASLDGPRSPAGGGRDAASPSAGRSGLDPRFRPEPVGSRAVGRASTRAADRSIPLLALRDPLDYLEAVGFVLEHVDRFRLGVIEEVVARKT